MIGSTPWLPAVGPFLLASVVTAILIPATMLVARRVGAVAEPDAARHFHRAPTPRLGGLALFGGFAAAMLVFGGPVPDRWQVVGVTAAITVAMLIDDILDLPWRVKLGMELGAGALAAALGITINFFAVPGGHGPSLVELGWLAAPITAFLSLGIGASINLDLALTGSPPGGGDRRDGSPQAAAVNRVQEPGDAEPGSSS